MDTESPRPGFRRELFMAALLFIIAGSVGMAYVANWPGTPSFCQDVFGPSVLFASDRGYANPDLSECPQLDTFLHPPMHTWRPPEMDVLPSGALPDHITTKPFDALQRREMYLLVAAGLTWRAMGLVAWSALVPLYGLLYGASAVALYGLFRLGMGYWLSACATLFLVVSPIQLQNLVRLRDYSKAPFMLAAILLIALLVHKPVSFRRTLGYSLACGVAVGLGLGFRFDVFICNGAFIAAALFLFPGKGLRNFAVRVAAITLFLAAEAAVSWPVLKELRTHGDKCHPALMGLAQLYDDRLGVDSDYRLVHRFLDTEPIAVVHAFAARLEETPYPVKIETPEYERLGDRFYAVVLKTFPADFVIRAYAAVLRILDELRAGSSNAVPRGVEHAVLAKLFFVRAFLVETALSHSRYVALLALLLIAARNLRLALAAAFLLAFFCGYPANQFASRNYFHLEFVSIWAAGFVAAQGLALLDALRQRDSRTRLTRMAASRDFQMRTFGRVAVFAAVVIVGLAALLWPLRWYQSGRIASILGAYDSADWESLPTETHPAEDGRIHVASPALAHLGARPSAPNALEFRYEFLTAEFDTAAATEDFSIRAVYDANIWDSKLDWEMRVPRVAASGKPGIVRVTFPAYYLSGLVADDAWTAFEGIALPPQALPAFRGLYRAVHPDRFDVLLTTVLRNADPMPVGYQRLAR